MVTDAQARGRHTWPVLLFGSVSLLLVLFVVLAGAVSIVPVVAAATDALTSGCPPPASATEAPPATVTTAAASPTAAAPPSVGPWAPCVDADANSIVYWALQAAPHLYDCGPQNLDECYDAQFPQPLIAWWQATCPRCSQWRNGNLQCVMLAGAIFGVAGLPLSWGPTGSANAIDFWSLYSSAPGWVEIPAAFAPGSLRPAPASTRGLPAPGDLMVWYAAGAPAEGHIAVVVQVIPPRNGQRGRVAFVEANGPGALVSETITPDLTVATWPGYTVTGYIRALAVPPAVTATPTRG